MISIDYASLKNARMQMQAGYVRASAHPDDELLRDGAIQRFEYCYELANKTLKRVLEREFDVAVDALPFKDMLRSGVEHGLLQDAVRWAQFREERNRAAHTYDGNIAQAVFQAGATFLPELDYLLSQLDRLAS